jgi:hypothetical protein
MPQNPLIKFEYVVKNITPDEIDDVTTSPVIIYDNATQFEEATRVQKESVPQQIEVWQHGPR